MGSDGADPPVFSLDVAVGDDGRATVAVGGELDLANVAAFSDAVRGALREGAVVIDLRELVFMDSAGVRALNTALHDADDVGADLRVCLGPHPSVIQVLDMTGMLALLPVEEAR